jgi:hypothetical protein
VTRFQFVADHQHAFEVKRMCELVDIERSSFYAWKAAAPARAARAAADAELAEKIRAIHAEDNTIGHRGRRRSSTTGFRRASGSTTSGSPG